MAVDGEDYDVVFLLPSGHVLSFFLSFRVFPIRFD